MHAESLVAFLRSADIVRFVATACRDERILGALVRDFGSLAAFVAIAKKVEYPVVAVEAMRLLRVIFTGGPPVEDESGEPDHLARCLQHWRTLPADLLGLLARKVAHGSTELAVATLLATHAVIPRLRDADSLGAGAAATLDRWANLAPGTASRAALDCIKVIKDHQGTGFSALFEELEHVGRQGRVGVQGGVMFGTLAERLVVAANDD